MRSIVTLSAACAAALSASTLPAAAAKWDCQGPAFVCGAPPSVSKPSSKKPSFKKAGYSRKSPNAVKSALDRKPKKSYSASKASSGGGYSGKASYYWQPQRVASGGWFNPNAMTAAHKTLPFGTKVRVTNRSNGKSVVVTINDRGPYIAGRIIDLSRAAAQRISMTGQGVAAVSVAVLGRG